VFSRSLSDYHLYTVDEVLAEYLTFYSAARPHVRADAVQTVRDILRDPHILPPYTFFLLNGDMELYRNKHLFV
jgi:hypothetical protein